ncbi:hypothetical protein AB0B66_07950 [Catellatospora sp. NPDC049111]|uniref:hypothetical protein n=1 Tax=Catellatospora sp. NPDC049111 TaxID=3155271 RepID=UPI0033DDB430
MPIDDTFPNLTPNQILALVVLMAEARQVSNSELKELAGFALTGTDNTKLVKLGLVETDRSQRPFTHLLTDTGWRVVRELHTSTPPKAGGSAARSLFTLLANVHRGLDRLQVSHAAFFTHTAVVGESTESAVRSAYDKLARSPGAWVGLAELREQLADIERGNLDETLRAMVHMDGVRIIPVADTKNLEPRDRVAALRIGAQDAHLIAIGQP